MNDKIVNDKMMSIADARKKLSEMELEFDRIPANSSTASEREYRSYLSMNIDTYRNAIKVFDDTAAKAV